MPDIFINYRSDDVPEAAAYINYDLSRRFGSDRVFYASESIAAGADFTKVLLPNVRTSKVLLAVMGSRWQLPVGTPDDWTRQELVAAFDCGVRVIPIRVGRERAAMDKAKLPPELLRLANCQYRSFYHRTAEEDLDRIARTLTDLVPGLVEKKDSGPAERPPEIVQTTHHQSGGVGNIVGNVGNLVTDARGPVHTGIGDQISLRHGDEER